VGEKRFEKGINQDPSINLQAPEKTHAPKSKFQANPKNQLRSSTIWASAIKGLGSWSFSGA
jgi:hypothetical protein